jgi:hypothetical protein
LIVGYDHADVCCIAQISRSPLKSFSCHTGPQSWHTCSIKSRLTSFERAVDR